MFCTSNAHSYSGFCRILWKGIETTREMRNIDPNTFILFSRQCFNQQFSWESPLKVSPYAPIYYGCFRWCNRFFHECNASNLRPIATQEYDRRVPPARVYRACTSSSIENHLNLRLYYSILHLFSFYSLSFRWIRLWRGWKRGIIVIALHHVPAHWLSNPQMSKRFIAARKHSIYNVISPALSQISTISPVMMM